jgi:hypothetical protein
MKSNCNDHRQGNYSSNRSNDKIYDDYNVLEPSPDINLSFQEEDEDELSDYSQMKNDFVPDYEE